MQLGNLSSADFAARTSDLAIIPVGGLEPHGPHLPLATDTLISEFFAARIVGELGGWVLPPIGYGVATPPYRLGGDFPGVVNIEGSTFTRLMTDMLMSLGRYGVQNFVVVNSAIDNVSFLCEAARLVREAKPAARIMIVAWWDVVGEQFRNDLADETGVPRWDDHHAGTVESSLAMYIAPAAVQGDPGGDAPTHRTRRIPYQIFPLPEDATTESGIVFTSAKASTEIGKRVADRAIAQMIAAVRSEFPAGNGGHCA